MDNVDFLLPAEFQVFAERLADEARQMSLSYFRKDLTIETKADESPVTVADRAIETLVRARLAETYPEHGVFGEEHGQDRIDAEYVWVIDPIDGTRSFVSGWPLWGTLFALLRNGAPVLGLIDVPMLRERWMATQQGCLMNGSSACHVSACKKLSDATVYATSPDLFSEEELEIFNDLSRQATSRRFGGDCYSYAMLASGHIDAVVEAGLQPYDYLPIVPVVEAAGGVVTDWQGKGVGVRSGGRIIAAATPELHDEILAITARL